MVNLQPPEIHNRRLIIAAATTCIVLAFKSLALRLYAPLSRGGPRYWFGDYWMAGVLLLCIGMVASEYKGLAKYGYGIHASGLDPGVVISFKKNLYVSMLLWAVATFSVKIGILLSYWHLSSPSNDGMFRKSIIGFAVCSICLLLVISIGFAAQCVPVSSFWDGDVTSVQPQCLKKTSFYLAATFINSLLNLGLMVLPLPVVWSWEASTRRRLALALLFLLGIFVFVASIVRVAGVSLIDWNDVTYTFVTYNIWGVIEVLIGFACANIISVAPMLSQWLHINEDSNAYRHFRKSYILRRQDSNGATSATMTRILATPSPLPSCHLPSIHNLVAMAGDDSTQYTNTSSTLDLSSYYNSKSPYISSSRRSSTLRTMMDQQQPQQQQEEQQQEEQQQQQQQQQQQRSPEEAGEENDSIHELLNQVVLMGTMRSATPTLRCGTPSTPGSRCATPTTPSDGPSMRQVSRISSRSSVRSSFGDIQIRRVVVLRVDGIEPGHRGQSFETHVTSCDDVSSCHSSERAA